MGGRCSGIIGSVLVLLAFAQPNAAADPPSRLRLPDGAASHTLTLTRGGAAHLHARCTINGQDAGWFVIDTGASGVVVDSAVAERLRLPRIATTQATVLGGAGRANTAIHHVDQVEFGGMAAGPRVVVVMDISKFPLVGDKFSGILGAEVLRELPFTLDYREGSLTFYRSADDVDAAAAARTNATPQRLRLVDYAPTLWAAVEGRGGWFMFDSGSGSTFDLYQPFAELNRDIRAGKHDLRHANPGVGGIMMSRRARFDSFEVAGRTFERRIGTYYEGPHTNASDKSDRTCAGALGAAFFKDARLTFDFARLKAWVEWLPPEDTQAYVRRIEAELKTDLFETPILLRATGDGRYDAVKPLVDGGADVNAIDQGGTTPLMACASHPDLVKLLLSKSADVNAVATLYANTALLHAAGSGSADAVRALLAAGADVDHATTLGETPLHLAAEADWPDVIAALTEGGVKVNKPNKERETPLVIACRFGRPQCVAALLRAGAEVDTRFGKGETPLMDSATSGNVEIAKALIAAGAKIDYQDPQGRTALMISAHCHTGPVARVLLAAGANRDLKSAGGKTAWDVAADAGSVDVLYALKYVNPPAIPAR